FLEERLAVGDRVRRRGLALEGRQWDAAASVVDEDPGLVGLATGHIPGVLVTGVGIARAIADPGRGDPCSRRVIPVPRVELELELGVGTVAELGDGGELQLIEVGFAVVQGPQDRERKGEDHPIERYVEWSGWAAEGQVVTSVGVHGDRGERRVELDA